VKYPEVSYTEVLSKALGVMDASAVAMCRDNHMPIMVFDLKIAGNIMRMAMGEPIGTVIRDLSARDLDYETGQPNYRAQ
jgi:uridylate kinase